jgi:hypothetical protein
VNTDATDIAKLRQDPFSEDDNAGTSPSKRDDGVATCSDQWRRLGRIRVIGCLQGGIFATVRRQEKGPRGAAVLAAHHFPSMALLDFETFA